MYEIIFKRHFHLSLSFSQVRHLKAAVSYCLLLTVVFLLPSTSFGVYDLLGIDVRPQTNDVSFCIDPDYSSTSLGQPYVAATLNGNLYFLSYKNSQIIITPYVSGKEPPIFSNKKDGKCCFGPFPKDALNGIQLFAAVGTSLEDVIKSSRYVCFYNGFPPLPSSKKEWTIMVYMVGSSLENGYYRLASKDINEMIDGTKGLPDDLVNMVLCTGAAQRTGWQTTKRSMIENGQLYVLQDLGSVSMSDANTLSDFVTWAEAQFPANHYALILWDHGGGAAGYGFYTSVYTSENGTRHYIRHHMDLNVLHEAFQRICQSTQKKLDIVAYDACLMGSIEVAEITSACAESMSASVDLEPYHGIDYCYLLSSLADRYKDTVSEDRRGIIDGNELGKLISGAYLHQARETGTFYRDPITYAVYDLRQLEGFNESFGMFCQDFDGEMERGTYLNYQALSRGIIRTISYPTTRKRAGNFGQKYIPIDLRGFLSSIGSSIGSYIPSLEGDVDEVLSSLNGLVVSKEDNINNIETQLPLSSGGISVDVGSEDSYLSELPKFASLLKEGIAAYIQKKEEDHFNPDGTLEIPDCPEGMICAPIPTWLVLESEDVLGVDGLFGRDMGDYTKISLTKPIYRAGPEISTTEIRLYADACSEYQICTAGTNCVDVSLRQKSDKGLFMADVYVNGIKSLLIATKSEEGSFSCGVVKQEEGMWGRIMEFQPGDVIEPISLYFKDGNLEEHKEPRIVVPDDGSVTLKRNPSLSNPTIIASFYGNNWSQRFERLCVSEGCAYCGITIK